MPSGEASIRFGHIWRKHVSMEHLRERKRTKSTVPTQGGERNDGPPGYRSDQWSRWGCSRCSGLLHEAVVSERWFAHCPARKSRAHLPELRPQFKVVFRVFGSRMLHCLTLLCAARCASLRRLQALAADAAPRSPTGWLRECRSRSLLSQRSFWSVESCGTLFGLGPSMKTRFSGPLWGGQRVPL